MMSKLRCVFHLNWMLDPSLCWKGWLQDWNFSQVVSVAIFVKIIADVSYPVHFWYFLTILLAIWLDARDRKIKIICWKYEIFDFHLRKSIIVKFKQNQSKSTFDYIEKVLPIKISLRTRSKYFDRNYFTYIYGFHLCI